MHLEESNGGKRESVLKAPLRRLVDSSTSCQITSAAVFSISQSSPPCPTELARYVLAVQAQLCCPGFSPLVHSSPEDHCLCPECPEVFSPKELSKTPCYWIISKTPLSSTGMGTGMGTGTGTVFIMAIGFAATSSRQHRSFWQQKPADTLNYAKVVFREIVITNILSQSSRH